ncbi:uncharacterized protein CTRU02_211535 [Colletotrichum truncatum]|uniref:Uncharacterized protein n=1 Tax=Colletotrichum truncatum TaxID=5467 RepID=A0ACC3YL90_COLTU|nr:uncharacterized protein CTRU02_13842 [Colletotrichum truncatum]KAF6782844.1 hypothetical protein CTRU02_13842 [Colletotrichum truncatum]
MEPQTPQSPLQRLPLHLVANILVQLDTIQQLGLLVLHHRVFYDALTDSTQTVAGSIITRQAPQNALPFAIALVESTRIDPSDHDAVRELLARLEADILKYHSTGVILSASHYTISEFAYLSRNLSALGILRNDMIAEALPIFNRRFDVEHSSSTTEQEDFRINRAFLRYQLMCNLFCLPSTVGGPLAKAERTQFFFSKYSPWVNTQMLCVYAYIERKVSEAFDDVAAHNVEHGAMRIPWQRHAAVNRQIQWHASRGLPFLASILSAKTYEERLEIMPIFPKKNRFRKLDPVNQLMLMVPEDGLSKPLSVTDPWLELGSCSAAMLHKLAGPLDGEQDAPGSTPYNLWVDGHSHIWVARHALFPQERHNMDSAYVMWDLDAPASDLEGKCHEAYGRVASYKRASTKWTESELTRSEKQRSYIYDCGGRGYWPRRQSQEEEFDFGRIYGLSDQQKEDLVAKFRMEIEMGIDDRWY